MAPTRALEIVERVFNAGLIRNTVSIVWHSGEPLTLPVAYYEEIFQGLCDLRLPTNIKHSFQTNGMLIDDTWCQLFRKWDVNVGVSIDGPAFIHDAHRKDRRGSGTHESVMKGVTCLREHNIDFHAIAVVTAEALDNATTIFDFFLSLGVSRVGFNIEEIEGQHSASGVTQIEHKVELFFRQLADCQERSCHRIAIREFDNALEAISRCPPPDGFRSLQNDQNTPLAILTIAYDGSFSTFSPELIDAHAGLYDDFVLGNIFNGELSNLLKSSKFESIANSIEIGRKRCEQSCEYFSVCGGGAPSNKLFENGSFESTETMYCRSVVKIPSQIMLERLERELL